MCETVEFGMARMAGPIPEGVGVIHTNIGRVHWKYSISRIRICED
jgi:hypothetical protein